MRVLPLIVGCWILFVAQVASSQDVTLSGTVRDKKTHAALSQALVQIKASDGRLIDSLRTDGTGNWTYLFRPTTVATPDRLPATFGLQQNYPNPFNPSTKIPFALQKSGRARFTVHNLVGQLLDERDVSLSPGEYTIDWFSKGSGGVLFVTLEVDGRRSTRKMIQLDGGKNGGFGSVLKHGGISFSSNEPVQLESCWAIASDVVHEPESLSVVVAGTPRVDLSLETVHERAFVMDLHNDVLEVISATNFQYDIGLRHSTNHTDLPRMKDGGLDAQLFSVWIDPNANSAGTYYMRGMQYLDSLSAQIKRNAPLMALTTKADSVLQLTQQGKTVGVLMLEGGHCLQDDIQNLKNFYEKGVRCMTITWNNSTSWAVSASDSRSATVGLSDFGKQVIRTMDSLGMIIDISHVGKKTIVDILETSARPIVATHSGCATLRDHSRNLTDDQIRAIAQRGGVIGVVFYPTFLSTSSTVSIDTVVKHIDYIKNLVGVDYIALGSDFDGIGTTPVGLEDVSKFPALTNALLRRGYSRSDVRKILGGNFLRVFKSVCG